MKIEIYNRFFHNYQLIGTTPLQEFQQNNLESRVTNNSDVEGQTSYVKQDRFPATVQRKFRHHESINLIRLKQTAKLHTEANDE